MWPSCPGLLSGRGQAARGPLPSGWAGPAGSRPRVSPGWSPALSAECSGVLFPARYLGRATGYRALERWESPQPPLHPHEETARLLRGQQCRVHAAPWVGRRRRAAGVGGWCWHLEGPASQHQLSSLSRLLCPTEAGRQGAGCRRGRDRGLVLSSADPWAVGCLWGGAPLHRGGGG